VHIKYHKNGLQQTWTVDCGHLTTCHKTYTTSSVDVQLPRSTQVRPGPLKDQLGKTEDCCHGIYCRPNPVPVTCSTKSKQWRYCDTEHWKTDQLAK